MASGPDQQRQEQLSDFATQYLPDFITCNHQSSPAPLDGDAGFRRYFRLQANPPVLAVDAPPDSEDSLAFVRVADLLKGLGVHAPTVYAANLHQGLLLVEDMGDRLYQDVIDNQTAPRLYQDALDTLFRIQSCVDRPPWLPHYETAFLRQELSLFSTWFVHELLKYELNESEAQLIDETFDLLVDSALAQPQVLVHRDYHCRNLIYSQDNNPGVIDFQDAVWGPITYDLVSLLRDCYVRFPQQRVSEQLELYSNRLLNAGLITSEQNDQMEAYFDLMGMQRHLKVLGIFSRLWLRDGKNGYLPDLPLVIRYVMEACSVHPQTHSFADWFVQHLIPVAEQQEWYGDWRCAGEDRTFWSMT